MKTNTPIRYLLTWSTYFGLAYASEVLIVMVAGMRATAELIIGLAVISAATATLITGLRGRQS